MADKKVNGEVPVQETPAIEEITLDEFLKDAEGSFTLKAMFAHYVQKVESKDVKTTKEAFTDLYEGFKVLPAEKL